MTFSSTLSCIDCSTISELCPVPPSDCFIASTLKFEDDLHTAYENVCVRRLCERVQVADLADTGLAGQEYDAALFRFSIGQCGEKGVQVSRSSNRQPYQ